MYTPALSAILCLWRSAGNTISKRKIYLEGYGPRPFLLAKSEVLGTKEGTQLFLKLKVFMPEMKLTATSARDALM